ncbi:PREDICTED: solute carrier family 2, facilitated glucose transporter member 3-like isoform X1 [Papilio xuthus]|uniref:Solute carrier family 2, facilitated glucose transporter member 3-like isoform X1 n=1 Tax=Papilio xuthus TaxID=66420 RepID=A0AAJ6ZX46_PAPXU|nr:PREDICTED: solute carrier family 2, facilitated glucose transporter member 3-like isoform X1 [Papilio xuthus]
MGEQTERTTLYADTTPRNSLPDISQAIANEHQQLTQSHEYKAGWSFFLVLAGVVTTIGLSLPVGYNIGVVNTPAEILKTFCNESFVSRYNLPLDEAWLNILWSSVVSAFIVGGCTGSILGSVLADKLGRKNASIATSCLFLAGAVLFLLCRAANSVEMLVLGRLLVGLAGGLTTSIVPMYLTELSPPSLTGAMGVACPMGVNVGVLVGQVMGLNFLLGGVEDWPYLLSVYAVLVIICLPLLYILPESPKYLYIVKKNEIAAMKQLSRLRGVSSSILSEDVETMREERRAAEAAATSGERAWSMARLAADTRLRLPLLLVCSTQAGQQTSGINAVFYYSQTIFMQAGLSVMSAQYATIGCGFINVCTAALMPYLLPRKGRRPLLLGSALCATLCLATLAAAMNAIELVSWMPYVCTVAVLLYVLVYGFGLGPIPYFIASEMFEVGPRPAAMAWGSLANWGGNFLVGLCFPTMRHLIGAYSFLIFSIITGALFLFVRKYFPETRSSTPAQVTERCSQGLRSRPLLRTNMPVV